MKNKEDLRVKRTHSLLQNALLNLLEYQSLEKITINQICEEAMVHRTTFYTHFQDKYELLSYSLKKIVEKELPFINKTLSPSENVKEILLTATKHRTVFTQILAQDRYSFKNIVRKDMRIGIKEHMMKELGMEENSIELEIAVEGYIGAILGVLSWLLENNITINEDIIHDSMFFFNNSL